MEVDSKPSTAPEAGPSSPSAVASSSSGPAPAPTSAPPLANGNGKSEDAEMKDEGEEEKGDELPEDASEVVYINNLNEKIKLNVMKQSLRTLFRQYGKVLDVVAHRNIRMRGQAFVTLETKETAAKAVKEVKGFPLYGKPMQLSFARTASDALVKSRNPDDFEAHKAERLVHKKMARKDNPLRRKHLAQLKATAAAAATALATGAPAVPAPTAASAARRIVQMPDEYLPPNKILFVQNLPDDTTKDALEALFRPYPNLSEVRTIPGRKNIAFVEFADEASSGAARDALHNTKVGELKLKVTFAKQ